MRSTTAHSHSHADLDAALQLTADVLVIGGGPAGAWAAVSAAAQGARVILVDKGFCGTSGATAPEGDARAQAKASRYAMGGQLAEQAWMDRVLAQTWDNVERLKEWGYPFPADAWGRLRCNSLQGPEYMRLMRRQAKAAGARILDHSPALELLVDAHGAVCGAFGVRRADGDAWTVRAGAVVIATGGCAFLSKALGCDLLTGDGYLMAAEAGAQLSGMEFSNAYGLGPAFSSVTKSLFYNWATFYDEGGAAIEGAGSSRGRGVIAQHLRSGPVYARLDRADAQIQAWMRVAQPNFFLSFDRLGIDPFAQRFPVTLRLEGTVRGTGGLNVVDAQCATSVPGLYAAGDAATRELICGGFTGGGSHNAAWALSSGFWAGAGAALFARDARAASDARRPARRAGAVSTAGPGGAAVDSRAVVRAVQAELFPTERNWVREAGLLEDSLGRLDALWAQLRRAGPVPAAGGVAGAAELLRAREAAAMLASARWMYRSALARTETRGMHRRRENPASDPAQRHRLLSGGLDAVWVARQAVREPAPPAPHDRVLEATA